MKHVILALTLGATIAAPLAASAETTASNPSAPAFLVVDAQSGRTLATLVPVNGMANDLHMIGTVSVPRPSAPQIADSKAQPLTPAQDEAAYQNYLRTEFSFPVDAGDHSW